MTDKLCSPRVCAITKWAEESWRCTGTVMKCSTASTSGFIYVKLSSKKLVVSLATCSLLASRMILKIQSMLTSQRARKSIEYSCCSFLLQVRPYPRLLLVFRKNFTELETACSFFKQHRCFPDGAQWILTPLSGILLFHDPKCLISRKPGWLSFDLLLHISLFLKNNLNAVFKQLTLKPD